MSYPPNIIIRKYEDVKALFNISIEYYDVHTTICCFLYEQHGKQYSSFSYHDIQLSYLDKGMLENVIFKAINSILGYKEKLISRLNIDGYIFQYALNYTKCCKTYGQVERTQMNKEYFESIMFLLNGIVLLNIAGQTLSNNFGRLDQSIVIKNYVMQTAELREKLHQSSYDGFLKASNVKLNYESDICSEMENNFKFLYGFDLKEFVIFIRNSTKLNLRIKQGKVAGDIRNMNISLKKVENIIKYFSQPMMNYSLGDIKIKFEKKQLRLIYKPIAIMKNGDILIPSQSLLYCSYNRLQRNIYHNLIEKLKPINGKLHKKLTDELVDRIYGMVRNDDRYYNKLFNCKINDIKGIIVYREFNGEIFLENDLQILTEYQLKQYFNIC